MILAPATNFNVSLLASEKTSAVPQVNPTPGSISITPKDQRLDSRTLKMSKIIYFLQLLKIISYQNNI